MQTNIPATKQELQRVEKVVSRLKQEMLQMRKLLKQQQLPTDYTMIKSREVRKMLRVSASTLQTMRNKGKISFTRMGGLLLYNYNDIRDLLLNGKTIKKQTL
ncbi:helix-turn-helix domain-containing protein [Chitinophaga oryziterrae]|uniref:Helix-turn-helix domain-containing protein n=1 Tax=Chitinophaga oryziterrae TaxID=1031224 RepID=A0A6N8J6E2_9BACT|nr:helix-turn-helix domain-containing protein [Chitinophaga oryziterrae]MVT40807.1 helix-turn-helix domain-containing protein [Chitinophaga oryziterrae]